MEITKCKFCKGNEKRDKVCEFIYSPTISGLIQLAEFLKCSVFVEPNIRQIYFYNENLKHKFEISIIPTLKNLEYADVVLSY